MSLVMTESYEREFANLQIIEKQLNLFSQYIGFQYYIDRRSNNIQIYDTDTCSEKLNYIHQNLIMIINCSSYN